MGCWMNGNTTNNNTLLSLQGKTIRLLQNPKIAVTTTLVPCKNVFYTRQYQKSSILGLYKPRSFNIVYQYTLRANKIIIYEEMNR